nr:helix-turn-helix transcriptional regulator [Lysobacter enzymogenes]
MLQWIAEGRTSREVGLILSIAERTVKFHLRNIYAKLNVLNRTQAVSIANRMNLG